MSDSESDYMLAIEEGRRALDQQAQALDGLRNRAVSVLGIGGLFGAFFGGLTTTSADRDMTGSLWIAVAAFGVAAMLCLWILVPHKFSFAHDAKVLVGWTDSGADRPTMGRELAESFGSLYVAHRPRLDRLLLIHTVAVAALIVEILALAWALRSA